ncbi:hypothetical protein WJX73_007991 [Symbiochloris irregularis]|uniref:Exostosin GT47 domain-containing protein n=1 Tax=Symbiochloris irregularis TaxID=706552 RepID=A0AAW1P2Z7_9CHLO
MAEALMGAVLLSISLLTAAAAATDVPWFYMYEGPEHDWLKNCSLTSEQDVAEYKVSQDGVSVHFLDAARTHPHRATHSDDPRIKLYIIPALIGLAARMHGCNGHTMDQMLEITGAAVLKSPAYHKRKGQDHFVIAFDWLAEQHDYKGSFQQLMKTVTVGGMETWAHSPGFCRVALPYNAHYNAKSSSDTTKPLFDYFFMGGAAEDRIGYHTRIRGAKVLGESDFNRAVVITEHPGVEKLFPETCNFDKCIRRRQCGPCRAPFDSELYQNLLSQSRYSMVFHGDTPTSGRLYDAIGSGVVPLLVSQGLWRLGLPFSGTVSWPDMTVGLPHNYSWTDLWSISNMPEHAYQLKVQAVKLHQQDLLWNHHDSRVFNNTLIHASKYCM